MQAQNTSSAAAAKLATQVEQIIVTRLASDRLAVPAMPPVAAKCLTLLRNPEFSTKQVVTLLEQDPVLTARILRLASSAAYNAGGGQLSLSNAVVRLGTQRIRSLLIEASTQQLYESRDRRIADASRAILEHSVAVALLARDLCAVTNQAAFAETAYLCGLLHDVGKLVVAAILLEAEKMIVMSRPGQLWVGSDEWVAAIARSHRSVGITLAEKWSLPEEVIQAIRDFGDYDNVNRTTPANYVRFANALTKKEGIYSGPVEESEVETLIVIGRSLLGVDDAVIGNALNGLKDRVKSQIG